MATAVACAYRDERFFLREFVEYHLAAGASRLYMCDLGSRDRGADLLERHVSTGAVVTVRPSDFEEGPRQTAPLGQALGMDVRAAFYAHAFRRARDDGVRHLALVDARDWIVSPDRSLPEALEALAAAYPHLGAVALARRMYGVPDAEPLRPGATIAGGLTSYADATTERLSRVATLIVWPDRTASVESQRAITPMAPFAVVDAVGRPASALPLLDGEVPTGDDALHINRYALGDGHHWVTVVAPRARALLGRAGAVDAASALADVDGPSPSGWETALALHEIARVSVGSAAGGHLAEWRRRRGDPPRPPRQPDFAFAGMAVSLVVALHLGPAVGTPGPSADAVWAWRQWAPLLCGGGSGRAMVREPFDLCVTVSSSTAADGRAPSDPAVDDDAAVRALESDISRWRARASGANNRVVRIAGNVQPADAWLRAAEDAAGCAEPPRQGRHGRRSPPRLMLALRAAPGHDDPVEAASEARAVLERALEGCAPPGTGPNDYATWEALLGARGAPDAPLIDHEGGSPGASWIRVTALAARAGPRRSFAKAARASHAASSRPDQDPTDPRTDVDAEAQREKSQTTVSGVPGPATTASTPPTVASVAPSSAIPKGVLLTAEDAITHVHAECERAARDETNSIHEHVPVLRAYAAACESATELAPVASAASWALCSGLLSQARPAGVLPRPAYAAVDMGAPAAQRGLAEMRFRAAMWALRGRMACDIRLAWNDAAVDIGRTDLLFIDSWHVHAHLEAQLERHAPGVVRYIILHDTQIDAVRGESVRLGRDVAAEAALFGYAEDGVRRGVWAAIETFLRCHRGVWWLRERRTNDNGLTVLERIADDVR